jgi:Ser/Thr protein kinase RdoA (MazF antagonist)
MVNYDILQQHLRRWDTILGSARQVGSEHPGRELWPVQATDGRRYFLKRIGRWRNLSLADQVRVLGHLARRGVPVAEFLVTDDAKLYAGAEDDSFVLMPHIDHDEPCPDDVSAADQIAGSAVASLHQALAEYPWDPHSYTEQFIDAMSGDLALPPDIDERFRRDRAQIIDVLAPLPTQLVHGDLTPDNVLVSIREGSAAFIDLDHLPRAPRIWDIGKYLSRRFRQTARARALASVTAFVGGYHRVSPLSEGEVLALPTMVTVMNLVEADWMEQILSGELDRRLLPEQKASLGPIHDALRWQFENSDRIGDAIIAGLG